MNTLKLIGTFLGNQLIPILLLIGLTIINVATYIGFSLVSGLFVTGITLVVVSTILMIETSLSNKTLKDK